MRHPATDFDISMLDFLSQMEIPYVVVLTKADKLNKTEFNKQLNSLTGIFNEMDVNVPVIPFSSVNGLGVEEVKRIIEEKVV